MVFHHHTRTLYVYDIGFISFYNKDSIVMHSCDLVKQYNTEVSSIVGGIGHPLRCEQYYFFEFAGHSVTVTVLANGYTSLNIRDLENFYLL